MGVQTALLPGGRLHLQHGPIDLVIGAEGARGAAFAAAARRLNGLLEGLVAELPLLRAPMQADAPRPDGAVARRMDRAVRPLCDVFVTRMAAVAGAVADEVLAAMRAAAPGLSRAYVNNGGDIALHLAGLARFRVAMAGEDGGGLGRIDLGAGDGVGGIATSGRGGRSLSRGIADSVTVLAADAAAADAAATLIANAVDLPGHPAIIRQPAHDVRPDSDLGGMAVVTGCGALTRAEVARALASGLALAQDMRAAGLIAGAALFLRGQAVALGHPALERHQKGLAHG